MVNIDLNLDKENPMTEDAFRQTAFSILNVNIFVRREATAFQASHRKQNKAIETKRIHSGKNSKFNIKSASNIKTIKAFLK